MSSDAPIGGIRACVFDAYGTLFDFASAAAGCRDVLGDSAGRLAALWRDKQLQYSWLRTVQGRHADFWQVTGDALDFSLETLGIREPGLRDRLMDLYLTLDPFPEVPAVLRRLRAAGLKTAILSNGTPQMLQGAVEAARIGGDLDAVLSVDAIRIYKPQMEVYALATAAFRLAPADVTFVSSNRWDVMGATAFGFRCIWVNRANAPEEYPEFAPVKVVRELGALATLEI